MRLTKLLTKSFKWWLGSTRAQIVGILGTVFVLSPIVYTCMKNGYIPVFELPIELGAIGLVAIFSAMAFLFTDTEQRAKLKYFAKMPWMNVLYVQVGTLLVLSVLSFVLTNAVAQDKPYGTVVRAYSASIGIMVIAIFCTESIALMRQLKIRGK